METDTNNGGDHPQNQGPNQQLPQHNSVTSSDACSTTTNDADGAVSDSPTCSKSETYLLALQRFSPGAQPFPTAAMFNNRAYTSPGSRRTSFSATPPPTSSTNPFCQPSPGDITPPPSPPRKDAAPTPMVLAPCSDPACDDYLSYVAMTGRPLFEWSLMKPLVLWKLERVMTEMAQCAPFDHVTSIPNTDKSTSKQYTDRILDAARQLPGVPFTVQRLCELLTQPRTHYKRADKFFRALEKNITVVTTVGAHGERETEKESGETYFNNWTVNHVYNSSDYAKVLLNGGDLTENGEMEDREPVGDSSSAQVAPEISQDPPEAEMQPETTPVREEEESKAQVSLEPEGEQRKEEPAEELLNSESDAKVQQKKDEDPILTTLAEPEKEAPADQMDTGGSQENETISTSDSTTGNNDQFVTFHFL